MLVLNRKEGEKICIDGQIIVTVNRIQGSRVSLAIEAPREIHVVRGELRPFVAELQPGKAPAPSRPARPEGPRWPKRGQPSSGNRTARRKT
jgi:carbon storage regulator CsrA